MAADHSELLDDLVAPDAPGWFRAALEVPFQDHTIDVDGCPIHYVAWGETDSEGLIFVHGGGAHAHWWTHVAAPFAKDYRVAALDLSGHGDSGRRDRYSIEQWTREVMAVAADMGAAGAPVLVGHSMGGMVTIATAGLHSDELAGVIICDSPVTEPDPEVGASRLGEFTRAKTYADPFDAVARFRTVPMQDNYLDFVMHHVSRRSLVETDEGWRWKFDQNLFAAFSSDVRGAALPYLDNVTCRLALLRSGLGLVTEDIGQFMYDRLGRVSPVVELPETGHHGMLDQPLLLLTAIRTLLADWDHSTPRLRDT